MSAPYYDQQHQGPPAPGYPAQPGQAYAPPPSHLPPQGQQQQSTAVIVGVPQVVTVVTSSLNEAPASVTCQTCHQAIVTRVTYEVGTLAWLICGGLALAGCFFLICWLGICFIPFCVKGCKDVRHTCPNCNSTVGVYRRM